LAIRPCVAPPDSILLGMASEISSPKSRFLKGGYFDFGALNMVTTVCAMRISNPDEYNDFEDSGKNYTASPNVSESWIVVSTLIHECIK
jgi:hypothetical protein